MDLRPIKVAARRARPTSPSSSPISVLACSLFCLMMYAGVLIAFLAGGWNPIIVAALVAILCPVFTVLLASLSRAITSAGERARKGRLLASASTTLAAALVIGYFVAERLQEDSLNQNLPEINATSAKSWAVFALEYGSRRLHASNWGMIGTALRNNSLFVLAHCSVAVAANITDSLWQTCLCAVSGLPFDLPKAKKCHARPP